MLQLIAQTLLHFVWQGVFLGAIYALLMRAIKHSGSNFRYLVSLLFFAGLATTPLLTFFILTSEPHSSYGAFLAGTESSLGLGIQSTIHTNGIAGFATDLLDTLAVLWILGSLLMLTRLFIGVLDIKTHLLAGTNVAPAWLQNIKSQISTRLGLSKNIILLLTSRVSAPCTFGFKTHYLLLPASLVTQLASDELELILAHELAHIKRYDYLINLLQRLIEALLFFHPVVWWLSNRIRLERELCCDEMAIEVCGNTRKYISILTLIGTGMRLGDLPIAMTGSDLLRRVEHLVNHQPQTQESPSPKTGPALGILLVLIGILALSNIFMAAQVGRPTSESTKVVISVPRFTSSFNSQTQLATNTYTGDLYVPNETGALPAIVIAQECDDPTPWHSKFQQLGYITLNIQRCQQNQSDQSNHFDKREYPIAAYAALNLLQTLEQVDKNRIGIFSTTQAGYVALSAAYKNGTRQLFEHNFSAAIAHNPECGKIIAETSIPVLVLLDQQHRNESSFHCRLMMADLKQNESGVAYLSSEEDIGQGLVQFMEQYI